MIAFATVTNAAAFKVGVNEPGLEVASVEKVDARAGVETSVLGASLKVLECGAETSVCGTRQKGLTSVLACGAEMDAKAGAETSVLGARLSGLTSGYACGAETSVQVAAGMDGRAAI